MKINVEHVLMGATGAVVLAAWLLSGVSFETGMKDWRDGDLIVQESKSVPVLPAFAVKDSAPVHMGIVQVTPAGPVVIEAREKVVETPLPEFVARGRARAYAVYRVASLSSNQAEQVISTARAQLGKTGDFFLDETQDNLYSSELVRLSFGTAGVTLGATERLRTLAKQNPLVQARFMGRWAESKPCKRRYLDHEQCWGLVSGYEVIPPQAIVTDARVSQVFLAKGTGETLIAGNASPTEAEPKLETPAVGLRP